ncbi:MAG: hypothetical protein KR126chlam4_00949 [Candidatus Anoxychlamydiales bacterium]|nr:hypothetical protein [Candidatus Anoxychlamydiales bacterium]
MRTPKVNYSQAQEILALDDARKSANLRLDKSAQKEFLKDERYFGIVKGLIDNNKKLSFLSKLIYKVKVNFYSIFNLSDDYAKTALEIAQLFPKPVTKKRTANKLSPTTLASASPTPAFIRPLGQLSRDPVATSLNRLSSDFPARQPAAGRGEAKDLPIERLEKPESQFDRENIHKYLTSEEKAILRNIEKIINQIITTENEITQVRLLKALTLQLSGIKRPIIQEALKQWSIARIENPIEA